MNYIHFILFQELVHFSLYKFLEYGKNKNENKQKKVECFQIESIPSVLCVKILMKMLKCLQKNTRY